MEVILEEPVVVITEADDREFEENVATVGLVLENMLDEISMYEKVKSEGEMDDVTSEFVYRTIADRNETYGLGEPDFSMEAFKQAPLKYSKESISSFLSSVWEKIKEIFAKILDYLTGKWDSTSASNVAAGRKADLDKREKKLKEAEKIVKDPSISTEKKAEHLNITFGSPEDIDPEIFNGYSTAPVTAKQLDYLVLLYKELYHRVNELFIKVVDDITFIQDRASGLIKGKELFDGPPHWKTTSFIQSSFDHEKIPAGAKSTMPGENDTRGLRVQYELLHGMVAIFHIDLNPLSLYQGKFYTLTKEDGVKTPTIARIHMDESLALGVQGKELAAAVERFSSVMTGKITACKNSIVKVQNIFDDVLESAADDMHEVRIALTALKDIQNLLGFTGRFASMLDSHSRELHHVIMKYPCKF